MMGPGMLTPINKPTPVNSAGHLNSPVINVVDKSDKSMHSHAFHLKKGPSFRDMKMASLLDSAKNMVESALEGNETVHHHHHHVVTKHSTCNPL